ncbi:hypothetical protein PN498_15020 [Oscillatoria sp. CS-180]|uniref:nSTAND1 domain-containing NTPase n=1 Tax=Oscillatoria sp. CS-180 TaxID=3021720 RepID=UPI00232AF108|nr:hypothetical protein [Oscillatoria sp. CS-180]MDB9527310.1 hypothetical protein [Oscillatoria sp. CS-180]
MATSNLSPLSSSNQDSLRSLIRSIERSQGIFSLILARCNYRSLRDRVQTLLKTQVQVPLQEVNLTPQTQSLYTAIRHTLGDDPPIALVINGLETVENLDCLLRVANQTREEFRNNLPCPLVIWVTDDILNRLIRNATDFESWASVTIEFESDLTALTQFILHTADDIFGQLLDSRENVFLDSEALDLGQDSPLRMELQAACEEVHRYLDPLPPDVEASSQFILGRAADNNEEKARQHYERSLELWQQVGNLERYAHVQFYIGFWWGNYSVRHAQDRWAGLQKSREYLEAALQNYQSLGKPDRVAQFINYLGEVLHRQEDWAALDARASEAFKLHQQFCNYFRQAKALGLMAAVSIAEKNWAQAEYRANLALTTWQKAIDLSDSIRDRSAFLDWETRFHRPWYLYYLGKAQRENRHLVAATQNLEEARKSAKPSYDPDLYTHILDELREIYFGQKDYLKAYKTRQLRREIQSKFNLRPFVGPGKLQANQKVTNPSLPSPKQNNQIAPEIETSARALDINALLQRVERKDFRLTIVYGPSGVGKSSIFQAGLIPALEQRTFEGRQVITVLQQVYQNWAQELGNQLTEVCQEVYTDTTQIQTLNSVEAILQQLQENGQQHFKTVLIFDQFEEFFFTNLNVEERYRFYDFAAACFKILDTEVILSMKEDYLHFLLACNRLSGLEIIDNNILDKKILYYIGNFAQEETYKIVKNRTKNTRIKFDDDLIDQMVKDLADPFDQIRPIELQIVGAQLQTDNITTLAEYRALGVGGIPPREVLVNRYLENVVEDCGPENEELAEIILYLLTNEDGTRPIRTKTELMQEKLCEVLSSHPQQIDLVLEIFVQAGLILLVPSSPVDSYQLVHDYLVNLIREKVQRKYQKKISDLETKIKGLGKTVRFLSGLLLSLMLVGSVLYLLYRNNRMLYQVTQLDRDSVENQRQFDGYQLISLESAIRVADRFQNRSILQNRTTLPTYTLQYILDNIYEEKWIDTRQTQIFAADVSPETQQVATAGLDKTVRIWNYAGNQVHRIDLSNHLEEESQIWDVRFLAGGDRIAVIDSLGQLKIWSLTPETSEPVVSIAAHTADNFLTRLAISPDKSVLATAGADGSIKLWNAETLDSVKTWPAHEDPISSLRFTPNGEQLISSSYDGSIRSWSLETDNVGSLLEEFFIPDASDTQLPINFGLAISPDGQILTAASEDGFVRMWDLASGEFARQFLAHNGRWVTAIDFIPTASIGTTEENSYQLVTADELGSIRSWSVDLVKSIHLQESRKLQELGGHQGWIWTLLYSAGVETDNSLLISTGIDGTLRFWDLTDVFQRSSSFITRYAGHHNPAFERNQAWSTNYSQDRKLLATSGTDDTAKVWQLPSASDPSAPSTPLFILKHENSPVEKCESLAIKETNNDVFWVVFSSDNSMIATAGADCTVRLWNSETGDLLLRENELGETSPLILPHEPDAAVYSVAFSPDGNLIASADSRGRLYLWTADGQQIGKPLSTAQFSGKQQQQPVFAVKFSPDGNYIATASEDGTVKLWAVQTEGSDRTLPTQPLVTLSGHRRGATSVDFSKDGLIATAGKDGSVRIWDMTLLLRQASTSNASRVNPPQPIQELSAYRRRVTWVEFHQTDESAPELLATASKDGSVIVWDRNLEGWGIRRPGRMFKPRYQFGGHEEGAFSATFLEEGKQIAVAEGNGGIKFWQLEETPELIQRACQWLDMGPVTSSDQRKSVGWKWPWADKKDPDVGEICRKY